MRVIIAGSRSYTDYSVLCQAITESGFDITTIISGGATGVDALGEKYAMEHNIPLERFPAEWTKYGKAAGPMRNRTMAQSADALIALKTPNSLGTADMIRQATKHGLKAYVKGIRDI